MSEKSERDQKIRDSYIANIKEKTGKTPDDFKKLAAKKTFAKTGEIVTWLKTEHGLGHGHAMLIAHMIQTGNDTAASPKGGQVSPIDAHFAGEKAGWRKAYDALAAKLAKFGADVEIAPNKTYINLVRGTKKFGIVQISARDRIDIGIKRKGAATDERFEAAGAWNAMVTHRVHITEPKQIDAAVLAWLKQAYDAA